MSQPHPNSFRQLQVVSITARCDLWGSTRGPLPNNMHCLFPNPCGILPASGLGPAIRTITLRGRTIRLHRYNACGIRSRIGRRNLGRTLPAGCPVKLPRILESIEQYHWPSRRVMYHRSHVAGPPWSLKPHHRDCITLHGRVQLPLST